MFKASRVTLLIVILAPTLYFFTSCNDDLDGSVTLTGTRLDIMTMLSSDDITQRATIDSDNFRFVSREGVIVRGGPSSFVFTEGGTEVVGMIDFEFTELFSKSDILQYGITTQTYKAILESDGEFLFRAFQNGQELSLATGKVLDVIVPNADPNSEMELFVPGEGFWLPNDNPLNVIVDGEPGYSFFADRLDWVNIDYFTKFDLELTNISFDLPEGYEDISIALFVVFRDRNIVLGTNGENLPIGEAISIVCIAAEDEETFRVDIQEVVVEEDLTVDLKPNRSSPEDIKTLLKTLD